MNAPSSSHTVYFDQPLLAPRFVSLISWTIFNSWHNLESPGRISFKKDKKVQGWRGFGAWPLHTRVFSRALEEAFDFQNRLKTRNFSPSDGFSIENTENADSVRIGPLRHPRYKDHQDFCSPSGFTQYLLRLLRHPRS